MSPEIEKWWRAQQRAEEAINAADKLAPRFDVGNLQGHVGVGEDERPVLYLIHRISSTKFETYELSEDEMVQLAHFILGDPDEAKETDDAEDQG